MWSCDHGCDRRLGGGTAKCRRSGLSGSPKASEFQLNEGKQEHGAGTPTYTHASFAGDAPFELPGAHFLVGGALLLVAVAISARNFEANGAAFPKQAEEVEVGLE